MVYQRTRIEIIEVEIEWPGGAAREQGLAVNWRRRGGAWEGLITRFTAGGGIRTEWLPASMLTAAGSS